jgi:hypothetical protein
MEEIINSLLSSSFSISSNFPLIIAFINSVQPSLVDTLLLASSIPIKCIYSNVIEHFFDFIEISIIYQIIGQVVWWIDGNYKHLFLLFYTIVFVCLFCYYIGVLVLSKDQQLYRIIIGITIFLII